MTPRIPVISGDELIRALGKFGYVRVRQRGSHVRLRHPSDLRRKPLTVLSRCTRPSLSALCGIYCAMRKSRSISWSPSFSGMFFDARLTGLYVFVNR